MSIDKERPKKQKAKQIYEGVHQALEELCEKLKREEEALKNGGQELKFAKAK